MPSPSSPAHSKPRSMFAGSRNILRSNDSTSLWNCTLSPGWTEEQSETLRLAVMKYGIGNWAKIIDSGYLPGKTNAQMNLQLQRLLGQQSTAEFAGLHIDPKVIGEQNSRIQGPEIRRKNNTIVNTGDKLSREELRNRIQNNKKMYELPEETWKAIELEYAPDEEAILEEKKKHLREMKVHLRAVKKQLHNLEFMHPARIEKLKVQLEREAGLLESPSNSETPTSPGSPSSSSSTPRRTTSETDNEIDQLADESEHEQTTPHTSKVTSANDEANSDMEEWMSATEDDNGMTTPVDEDVTPTAKKVRKD